MSNDDQVPELDPVSDNGSVDTGPARSAYVPVLTNKTYDRLKFFVMVFLPGIATFYATLSVIFTQRFGDVLFWSFSSEVTGVAVALGVLIGLFLNNSANKYNASDERFDGTAYIKKDTNSLDETVLKVGYDYTTPAEEIENKSEMVLKVKEAPDDLMGPK